ncbi:hypothetical protein ACIQNI_28695 [Streptomyces sp. NPDC091266]|uniref:NucA/NucB deoxyribonuclease domain-containing protein n=1 Tax=Streptomyces sp. NPDC091266 TaxID=3365978 RepID=UPI003809F876
MAPSAGAVPYPEPAHSMTSEQCFKALNGTGVKFYIESRYAVCSGASFTQTWFKNNKPVGQSQFVLVAKAVIAKSSRTVTVQYDYLHLDQVGQSGAGGMTISPDVSLPKKWPSTATIRQGGSIPAPRSWAAIKADPDPGFEHTVTVDVGQGSGKDDTAFAVYIPKVGIKPPAGWKMGGSKGGELFMLSPRWDTAPYLAKKGKGAAVLSYVAPMPFSTAASAKEEQAAKHIKKAFKDPAATNPSNTKKDVPGDTAKRPLNRLYYDEKRRDDNRDTAIANCKKYWGRDYSKGGTYECDEYPFASTYQGAAQDSKKYDPTGKAPKKNYSSMPIPKDDNQWGGKIISGFYSKNRIIDGPDDGYTVKIN